MKVVNIRITKQFEDIETSDEFINAIIAAAEPYTAKVDVVEMKQYSQQELIDVARSVANKVSPPQA